MPRPASVLLPSSSIGLAFGPGPVPPTRPHSWLCLCTASVDRCPGLLPEEICPFEQDEAFWMLWKYKSLVHFRSWLWSFLPWNFCCKKHHRKATPPFCLPASQTLLLRGIVVNSFHFSLIFFVNTLPVIFAYERRGFSSDTATARPPSSSTMSFQ